MGIKWAAALAGGVVISCGLMIGAAAPVLASSQRSAHVVRVIDGDTFEIAGGAKIRVRNFDTPELRNYDCPAEKRLAQVARDVARDLLQGQRVTLLIDGKDRYRRLVADVTVHRGGRRIDFVDFMVGQGVGAYWNYGKEPQPDWCGGQQAHAPAPAEPSWGKAVRWMVDALVKSR